MEATHWIATSTWSPMGDIYGVGTTATEALYDAWHESGDLDMACALIPATARLVARLRSLQGMMTRVHWSTWPDARGRLVADLATAYGERAPGSGEGAGT